MISMQLKTLGEEGWIERLKAQFSPPPGVLGIGDDAAAVPFDEKTFQLFTIDSLVEDTHFRRSWGEWCSLGKKLVHISASDIAAMGGKPEYALLSVGLTSDLDERILSEFLEGLHTALNELGISLIGGNSVRSETLFFEMTVIGRVDRDHLKKREGVQCGDRLVLTNPVGGAAIGRALLEKKVKHDDRLLPFLEPKAQIQEGRWLGAAKAVHAMIDVSDGLYVDLKRLAKASCVDVLIELDQLYVDPQVSLFAKEEKISPEEFTLFGGEDYALLVAIDPQEWMSIFHLFKKQFNRSLHQVGIAIPGEGNVHIHKNGKAVPLEDRSFRHF